MKNAKNISLLLMLALVFIGCSPEEEESTDKTGTFNITATTTTQSGSITFSDISAVSSGTSTEIIVKSWNDESYFWSGEGEAVFECNSDGAPSCSEVKSITCDRTYTASDYAEYSCSSPSYDNAVSFKAKWLNSTGDDVTLVLLFEDRNLPDPSGNYSYSWTWAESSLVDHKDF